MKGTQWYRAGLMNAMKPWTGNYGSQTRDGSFTAGPMIWAAAHTTQFTRAGWLYLKTSGAAAQPAGAGFGAGLLAHGGSFVTLGDYSASAPGAAAADYTIVVEKMSSEHSSCVRPHLAPYPSAPELATFQLAGPMRGRVTSLNVWYTHWAYYPGDTTVEFQQLAPITVAADGTFSLNVTVDSLYTLTTLATGGKGAPPALPPAATLFPATWTDDFEACAISSEAAYWADQNGIWECNESGDAAHGIVMQQMVPIKPVTWGGDVRPHSLIGHRDTFDASLVIDAYITEPGASALVGVHAQGTDNPVGHLFLMRADGSWALYGRISDVDAPGKEVAKGASPVPVAPGQWHTYRVDVNGSTLNVWVDGVPALAAFNASAAGLPTSGHFVIGTGAYGHFTQFDNVQLYSTFRSCPGSAVPAAGSPVVMSNCIGEVGPHANTAWAWSAAPGGWNGTFSLAAHPELCLASAPADASGTAWLVLAACNPADPLQVWQWDFEGIAPDNERKSAIFNSAGCIDQYSQGSDIGQQLDAYQCNGGTNQAFFYDFDEGMISNEWSAVCLGVGPCDA
jgi:galactosylceramidase